MKQNSLHTGIRFYATSATTMVVFCLMLTATLVGCLDIPDAPDSNRRIEYANVYVVQKGISDSTTLKIHPSDPATLKVDVYPRQYKKELSFEWFRTGIFADSSDLKSVGTGDEFVIDEETAPIFIPNTLQITDQQGNSMTVKFNVIVNTPPKMDSVTTPANKDTLYGTLSTSFPFTWGATDPDLRYEDSLSYVLIIDSVSYDIGSLTQIMQSGFNEGAHTFQVLVSDSHGDSDTLPVCHFYVVDTLGGKK